MRDPEGLDFILPAPDGRVAEWHLPVKRTRSGRLAAKRGRTSRRQTASRPAPHVRAPDTGDAVVAYLSGSPADLSYQRHVLAEYAATHDLRVVGEQAETVPRGEALTAALRALDAGEAGGLLVFDLSRVVRTKRELDRLAADGRFVVSVVGGVDTRRPEGRYVATVVARLLRDDQAMPPPAPGRLAAPRARPAAVEDDIVAPAESRINRGRASAPPDLVIPGPHVHAIRSALRSLFAPRRRAPRSP